MRSRAISEDLLDLFIAEMTEQMSEAIESSRTVIDCLQFIGKFLQGGDDKTIALLDFDKRINENNRIEFIILF